MHGGVILFRGNGADARRYVEADRSRADDYYLGADSAVAQFVQLDGSGAVAGEASLAPEVYAEWVDWTHPLTGESMGTPRLPGEARRGSPRFAEMVVNAPKSLSIAAALHPEVSAALDAAQHDAAAEIQRWLATHSVTRAGPRGLQEVVPVESLQTVAVTHRTSRAGDPHRHIHFQIGTRVWAAGKWRALDTGALFRQQGAIRALGTAVIAAHPQLAEALDRHRLTLDPRTGEVVELEPFNSVMSKRGEQVARNLARLESKWEAVHPGETAGPVVSARLVAQAWALGRPAKKPTTLREEHAWQAELRDAGYAPDTLRRPAPREPVSVDDLRAQVVASRALDRCAAGASAWPRHTVQEHVTRIVTEYGVRATPDRLRDFITVATALAMEDCFSILPPGSPTPEHVAHLTSVGVLRAETNLRDLLTARVPDDEAEHPDVAAHAAALELQLDSGQLVAAAAVASADPLVVVEGAAGAGKTTMLSTAIRASQAAGRGVLVVAPTRKAADVAHQELGVPAESVAALVHAHGWRWNRDGVWTRLGLGDLDPDTGHAYAGPPQWARLAASERVVVDEAGMLDQDTAVALLTVCAESGATVALVGDRAQLAAVGRGGVLDIAAQLRGQVFDMAEVHRFTDPDYADLTLDMRAGADPGRVFDQLQALGLVRLHAGDGMRVHVADAFRDDEAITVSSNDDARALNARIREERVNRGLIDDVVTVIGSDGLPIGRGDRVQTRRNDASLGVANRQTWIVQRTEADGALWVHEASHEHRAEQSVRLPAEYVSEHVHLCYATTAYGVQGSTVARSHTVLTDMTSAAAVYVGMTRGRKENLLHVVAESVADAREQFTQAMKRDRADRGLTDATTRAAEEITGLVDDGPVKLVNAEIAALAKQAQDAERRAARWLMIAEHLGAQAEVHRAETDEAASEVEALREHVEQVRFEVQAPILAAAEADRHDHDDAVSSVAETSAQLRAASRLRKPKARRAHRTATDRAERAQARLRERWGKTPNIGQATEAWTAQVADRATASDPRVVQSEQALAVATRKQQEMIRRHRDERRTLLAKLYGPEQVRRDPVRYELTNARSKAAKWTTTAEQARDQIAALRALPPDQAAARVQAQHDAAAVREAQRREATEQVREDFQHREAERMRKGGTSKRQGPLSSL
ncbi:MobF family relaxase [Sinomonas terrae]|uniref:AAA family ATPase n=1 Tax=Sinomonas terrae TaxID=2908838 RepID=A0ABS9U133_9MICC|nr:MobF family relaxase [Sinomonas terrae]MCH6470398.1 AAA family ATPase [Sinomonas terrae]